MIFWMTWWKIGINLSFVWLFCRIENSLPVTRYIAVLDSCLSHDMQWKHLNSRINHNIASGMHWMWLVQAECSGVIGAENNYQRNSSTIPTELTRKYTNYNDRCLIIYRPTLLQITGTAFQHSYVTVYKRTHWISTFIIPCNLPSSSDSNTS